MTLRVLFADDQLPSANDAQNERTRGEIRRELAGKLGIENIDKSFQEDFVWFQGLLDYLQTGLYYRLEQLRYLGFLTRRAIGRSAGEPDFGWTLSSKYQAELD